MSTKKEANINTKILLIEDNDETVESIKLIFEHYCPDMPIIYSKTGKEGIEMALNECPDAIILDLGLPDISGFEVLRSIRLFSSIPIIILTAHGEEDNIVKALEMDANDYLVKPFKQRELLARIEMHVSKWRANEIRHRFKI